MLTVDVGVHLEAAPEQVWRYLNRVEDWWVPSNPDEHVSLEILGERGSVDDGTPIRIRESVAGVPVRHWATFPTSWTRRRGHGGPRRPSTDTLDSA